MTRGVKIALIALIVVIIVAAIMFLIWAFLTKPEAIFPPAPEPVTTEEPTGLPTTGVGTGGVVTELEPEEIEPVIEISSTEEIERQRVKNTSVLFTERFGSFSNQGDYQNIKDVMPLMTSSMQDWAEGQIGEGAADGEPYYGVSTKVISTNIKSFDLATGRAEVNLDAQRHETRTGEEARTYYQTLNLVLIKVGSEWLIDFAKWQ